ncbi:MAG: peptide MFS transporter [Prevotellaceae bacterium]|jgi:POT family proton-dependent oligopeptide transporter|nr:peptide MFS transporter [Prevotellaceae bacterium]
MFKNHPKGLLAASLSNMGERFGFYTMMAILVLFLEAKFGLSGSESGLIYSIFYALIYILALAGGLIADKTRNYKGTIFVGIVIMALGYLSLTIPTPTPVPNKTLYLVLTCFGLFTIAFGNGLFKGNLQALVGQMYDNGKFGKMRDAGFSLFYMFINVGAIFAPLIAVGVRNWWLSRFGFEYNATMPALCHSYLDKGGQLTAESITQITDFAAKSSYTDLTAFSNDYLNVFNHGFQWAFGVAIVAMMVSLLIYLVNKRGFPDVNKAAAGANTRPDAATVKIDAKEIKQRLYALFAVFGIVIFFWFSFHQNGLTLTKFAKDYTDLTQIRLNLGFTVFEGAELFQSINPLFVVLLTPIIMGLFGWLRAKGKEPSTPKKIGIGMGIAAAAYIVMALGSYLSNLPLYETINPEAGGTPLAADSLVRVTPFLLIGTYIILTVAELFISPLGISFVSRVAPPQYQGIMQGCWLGATAVGNQLLFIGAVLYEHIPVWATWTVFVVACCVSMTVMLVMLKWLERVAK